MNKEELLEYSNRIVNLEKEVLKDFFLIELNELEALQLENNIKSLIEVQAENKEDKSLSNETKRKIELNRRLKDNMDYSKRLDLIKSFKDNIDKNKIKISHLKRVIQIEIAFKNEV